MRKDNRRDFLNAFFWPGNRYFKWLNQSYLRSNYCGHNYLRRSDPDMPFACAHVTLGELDFSITHFQRATDMPLPVVITEETVAVSRAVRIKLIFNIGRLPGIERLTCEQHVIIQYTRFCIFKWSHLKTQAMLVIKLVGEFDSNIRERSGASDIC